METTMYKHEVGASIAEHFRHKHLHMLKRATHTRKHTHSQACKMMSKPFMNSEPVLAWEREARDIERFVSTCYVMFMSYYAM